MPLPSFLTRSLFTRSADGRLVRSPRVDACFFLLLGAVVIAEPLWIACASLPPHPDAATGLYAALLLLAGNGLTAGFAPGLPAAWCHLLLPAAWAAKTLGVAPAAACYGYVAALAALSLVLCRTLLVRLLPGASHLLRHAALFFLAFAFLGLPLAGRRFGQPAHVMAILAMPWFLALGVRVTGGNLTRWVAWPCGLLAGIGFLAAPNALPIWLGGECIAGLAARRRGALALHMLRPEGVAIPFVLALSSLALMTRGAAFAVALPVPLESPWRLAALTADPAAVVFVAGLLACCLALPWLRRVHAGLAALVPLLPAMALPAFFPHTAWTHPTIAGAAPALFLSCTAGFARYDAWRQRRGSRLGTPLLLLGLMAAGFGLGQWTVMHNAMRQVASGDPTLSGAATAFAANKPIYVVSTRPAPAFGLILETGSCWPVRHATLAALPPFYASTPQDTPIVFHAPDTMSPTEKYLLTTVVDDLVATPPALLVFDLTSPQPGFGGHVFNYLEYLALDPRFVTLMRGYTPVIPPIANYLLMRRLPGEPVGLCPVLGEPATPPGQAMSAVRPKE
ncbi:MAG: hypothetical protein AB7E47_11100 [Desulfovibrionaceae bacterium]